MFIPNIKNTQELRLFIGILANTELDINCNLNSGLLPIKIFFLKETISDTNKNELQAMP
jgi:hypothetical protein